MQVSLRDSSTIALSAALIDSVNDEGGHTYNGREKEITEGKILHRLVGLDRPLPAKFQIFAKRTNIAGFELGNRK